MPTILPKITPFLWFDGNAEEAARFYTSVFKNSRITGMSHAPEGGPLPKGAVMTVSFELCGQQFIGLNGGPGHPFTQSVSLFVACDTQAQIDEYWEKLTAGGGQPVQCGWLRDRFGLSWQIHPARIMDYLNDPATAPRVFQAMLTMAKMDLASIEAAAKAR